MAKITVVIDGATEPVSLGMTLAGGRVCAAMEGETEPDGALEAGLMALANHIGPDGTRKTLSAMYHSRKNR